MAKITFATFGSLGDLYPFIGLGLALAARGHTGTIATHACHRGHVPPPLSFHPLRPDMPADRAFHTRFMHSRTGPRFAHKDFLSPAIAASYEDLSAAVIGADLLISQTLMLAAPLVAASTGIKWLSAVFQPFTLYSAFDPPSLPGLPLIKNPQRDWHFALNKKLLTYAQRFTESWVAPVTTLRDRLGIAPYGHPMFDGQLSPQGTLAMFPPLFGTPQPDWPPHTVQTGAISYQPANENDLPPSIADFLASGPLPLIFTLGASASRGASRFFDTAVQIAQRLNCRALLIGDNSIGTLPPDILRCGPLPYAKIFPHSAAVIQPGGIGTALLALQAQRPQLLVPFAHDQADNARRIERAGLGKVLPINRFTAGRGAAALQLLLNDKSLPARLAAADTRDGTAAAIAAIERSLAA